MTTEAHYCTYCDAARIPSAGYECPECGNRLAGQMSLADEIASIERGARRRFETALESFGPAYSARHPRF